MRDIISITIAALIILINTSCNYHLRDTFTKVSNKIKIITIKSCDPFGILTNAVRKELIVNNIKIINFIKNKNNIQPLLEILKLSENQIAVSILKDGKIAECQIILHIKAQILISGRKYYPINIKLNRSFFNNQLTPLTQGTQKDFIRHELFLEAAQQLVYKILVLYDIITNNKNI